MGDSQRGPPDPEARETVEEWYYKRYRSGTAAAVLPHPRGHRGAAPSLQGRVPLPVHHHRQVQQAAGGGTHRQRRDGDLPGRPQGPHGRRRLASAPSLGPPGHQQPRGPLG